MSAEVQTALINEVLEQAHMFRENATLKHGLTGCKPAQRVGTIEQPKQEPPVVNITNNIPAAPAATPSSSPGTDAAVSTGRSLARTVAPYILTAVGGAGLAAGANYLLRDNPTPVIQPDDGSLLQYLQDQGFHLSEGAWPTK